MLVLKKNGSYEEFNIHKIRTSIDNCKCSANCFMNEGDLEALTSQFNKILEKVTKGNSHTSTYEIRGIIYHILMDNGFTKVARSYMKLC